MVSTPVGLSDLLRFLTGEHCLSSVCQGERWRRKEGELGEKKEKKSGYFC